MSTSNNQMNNVEEVKYYLDIKWKECTDSGLKEQSNIGSALYQITTDALKILEVAGSKAHNSIDDEPAT